MDVNCPFVLCEKLPKQSSVENTTLNLNIYSKVAVYLQRCLISRQAQIVEIAVAL
jgi:hypothetical protein